MSEHPAEQLKEAIKGLLSTNYTGEQVRNLFDNLLTQEQHEAERQWIGSDVDAAMEHAGISVDSPAYAGMRSAMEKQRGELPREEFFKLYGMKAPETLKKVMLGRVPK